MVIKAVRRKKKVEMQSNFLKYELRYEMLTIILSFERI